MSDKQHYYDTHDVLAEFKNEDGHEFILYRRKDGKTVYITSEIYEWRFGLRYMPNMGSVIDEYYLTELTKATINRAIAKLTI